MGSISSSEVTAVGNINIDLVFMTSKYPRRDEETPAENFIVSHGGSAANFAVGVSRLGIKCSLVGCVGRDQFGSTAINALESEGIITEGILVCETGTGTVGIIVEGDHRSMIAWRGANVKLLDAVRRRGFGTSRLIHVSNVPKEVLHEVLGRKGEALVSFDPGGAALEYSPKELHGVDLLLLNESELRTVLRDGYTKEMLLQAVETFVVKQGARGATLLRKGLKAHCPAFKVKVSDTTGAGDAFDAAFIAAYMRGHDPEEALVWGCGGAAIKIQKIGTRGGLPRIKELTDLIGTKKRRF